MSDTLTLSLLLQEQVLTQVAAGTRVEHPRTSVVAMESANSIIKPSPLTSCRLSIVSNYHLAIRSSTTRRKDPCGLWPRIECYRTPPHSPYNVDTHAVAKQ
jgi:hypothetical protein